MSPEYIKEIAIASIKMAIREFFKSPTKINKRLLEDAAEAFEELGIVIDEITTGRDARTVEEYNIAMKITGHKL